MSKKIADYLYSSLMEMFEPNRSPYQSTSYMESTESEPSQGAGCLFLAKSTGNVLFACRSHTCDHAHTWAGFGGGVDAGESPAQALERELMEEAEFTDQANYIGVCVHKDPKTGFEYYNYLVLVEDEFEPVLNSETEDFMWTPITDPPSPLHPGLEEVMWLYEKAIAKVSK